MARRPLIMRLAAAIAAAIALPSIASAQSIEACEAPWLEADRLRAILQIELADRWDPTIDAIVVRVEACETELPRVSLIAPDGEPTSLTLRLDAVAPRARTRFVALIVAELLRTRAVAAPDAPIAAASEAPPDTLPEPPIAEPPAPDREPVHEIADEIAGARAAGGIVAPEPASPPAPPAPAVARDALASPLPATAPAIIEERATPTPIASSPWRLAVGLAARVFVEHPTPAGLVDVSLRFDRLLLVIGGGGTEIGSSAGVVRFGQLTAGIGVRLLEHHGSVRVGWDLRGDAGATIASGADAVEGVVAATTLTYVLAASTQLEIVWPVGPLELGLTTDLGYQRGVVEDGPFIHGGLGGLFASLGGTVAWSL